MTKQQITMQISYETWEAIKNQRRINQTFEDVILEWKDAFDRSKRK